MVGDKDWSRGNEITQRWNVGDLIRGKWWPFKWVRGGGGCKTYMYNVVHFSCTSISNNKKPSSRFLSDTNPCAHTEAGRDPFMLVYKGIRQGCLNCDKGLRVFKSTTRNFCSPSEHLCIDNFVTVVIINTQINHHITLNTCECLGMCAKNK